MENMVVYYKPGCPFAIRLRGALAFYGVPFQAVRFRADEAGAAAVRAVTGGFEISPTVRVDSDYLPHPTVGAVLRAARLSPEAGRSTPGRRGWWPARRGARRPVRPR